MNKSLIHTIAEFLLGKKYYCNIIATNGVVKYEVTSYIFHSKEKAREHRKRIETTRTYRFVETVSFRSKIYYPESELPN